MVTIDGPVHRNHLIAISEGTKIDGVKCIPDLVEPLDVQSNTKRTRIRIAVLIFSIIPHFIRFRIDFTVCFMNSKFFIG